MAKKKSIEKARIWAEKKAKWIRERTSSKTAEATYQNHLKMISEESDPDKLYEWSKEIIDQFNEGVTKMRKDAINDLKEFGIEVATDTTYIYKLKTKKQIDAYVLKLKNKVIKEKLSICVSLCYPESIKEKIRKSCSVSEMEQVMRTYRMSKEYDVLCERLEDCKKKTKNRYAVDRKTKFNERSLFFKEKADALSFLIKVKDQVAEYDIFSSFDGLYELHLKLKSDVSGVIFSRNFIKPFFVLRHTNDYQHIYKYVGGAKAKSSSFKSNDELMPREDIEVPDIKEVK